MKDDNIHTGICIVMPASHYGSDELSHCTVVFLGNTDEVDYPKSRAERVLLHLQDRYLRENKGREQALVWVDRLDMFGVERNQPVAILTKSEKLFDLRAYTEETLDAYDMPYSTMFEYTPHVSLNNSRGLPMLYPGQPIRLGPPVLWWGEDRPKLSQPYWVGQ